MQRLAVAVAAVLCSLSLFAADTTYELLTAPWVQDRLRFQVTQDGKLQALRDGSRTYVDIADGAPFVLSEQRDLVFRDFNPFKIAIQTTETTEKDPNYTAIAQFLDALKQTNDQLALSKTTPSQTQQIRDLLPKITAPEPRVAAGVEDCSQYNALQKHLYEIHDLLKKEVLTTSEFKQWADSASGAANVANVRKEIDSSIKKLQNNVDALKELDAAIATNFIPENKDGQPTCDQIKASTFALVYEITRGIDSKVEARKHLISDLQTLNTSLKKYADPAAWREDSKTDYIFYKPAPDFQTIKILNIAVKPRSFSLSDDGKLSVEEGTGVARSIRLRAFSRIVPEVAAGFIHTDLAYPKYGTKEVGGQTVVARAGSDKLPVDGAILLNLVCRCWAPSVVYPALQLGVTNAKQYPGFLVGGGLRFAGKYSFSLIGGWVITWFDDLEGLEINQPISGTAELQSHLKRRRAPTRTYAGVQYNF